MAKVVKAAGQSAAQSRARTMHGSAAEHRLQALNGSDLRNFTKPGGSLTMGNANQRTRSGRGPGKQRED